jgi:hypothetical protein
MLIADLPPFVTSAITTDYLGYADDLLIACSDLQSAQEKLNKVNDAGELGGLEVSPPKTHIVEVRAATPVDTIDSSSISEIELSALKFPCPLCGRRLAKERSRKKHMTSWCTGDPWERSMKGTLAEKILLGNREKVLREAAREEQEIRVALKGKNIPNLDFDIYLGSKINGCGNWREDFDRRKAISITKFNSMRKILTSGALPLKMRTSIFIVSISTILLYGSDCWLGGPTGILEELRKTTWTFAWMLASNKRPLTGNAAKRKARRIANLINLPKLLLERRLRWMRLLFLTSTDVPSKEVFHTKKEWFLPWLHGLDWGYASSLAASKEKWELFTSECTERRCQLDSKKEKSKIDNRPKDRRKQNTITKDYMENLFNRRAESNAKWNKWANIQAPNIP